MTQVVVQFIMAKMSKIKFKLSLPYKVYKQRRADGTYYLHIHVELKYVLYHPDASERRSCINRIDSE